MKKLKLYLGIFISGVISTAILFIHLFRDSDSDSELSQLENEGVALENDANALEAELDSLEVDDLSDAEIEEYWNGEL
jgi:hypothetical protein